MKTRSKLLVLILGASLVLGLLGGCGKKAAANTLFIAFAQNASDENMNKWQEGVKKYYEDWNAAGKTPTIKYTSTNAETNIDTQISNVDALIAMKVNVILLNSVDTKGIVPAIRRARAAGIKIIENRGVDPKEIDVFYNVSEEAMFTQASKWWHSYLDSNPDAVCKAGGIYGLSTQTEQLKRIDLLFADLAKSYPDRFIVLDKQYGDWDTAKAMSITEAWLQSQPEMNCIVAAGAQMVLGAVNAVVAAGGDMKKWTFTTVDSTADAFSMLAKGQLDMTVGIDVAKQAIDSAQLAIDVGTGKFTGKVYTVPPEIFPMITPDNYQQYMPKQ